MMRCWENTRVCSLYTYTICIYCPSGVPDVTESGRSRRTRRSRRVGNSNCRRSNVSVCVFRVPQRQKTTRETE